MVEINPGDIPLPAFLDPLLDYFEESLPSPLYAAVISLLSHSLAVISAFFTLLASLLTTNPANWDAQTFLPPIIALLTAYLALSSLYRTTTWMLRTSFWFVKWGAILGALIAAVGTMMRSGEVGALGAVSGLGGMLMGMLNGEAGKNRENVSRRRPRGKRPSQSRPKAWDSFDKHKEWQYQENEARDRSDEGLGSVIQEIITSAEESGWWNFAQGILGGTDERPQKEGTNKKAAKSKGSTSR